MSGEIRGSEGLKRDLQRQIALLGSRVPAYARVLRTIVDLVAGRTVDTDLKERLDHVWQGRSFDAYYSRPLLLLASIRADVLADGPSHPLWAALGSGGSDPSTVSRAAVSEALHERRLGLWLALRTRTVQTNEVSRSVSWRWPAALAGADRGRRPLALVDIGASAGLNLVADRLDLQWLDQRGASIPAARDVDAPLRLGLDRAPLDATDAGDAAWLRACVWPGEHERLTRLEAAIAAFEAAGSDRPRVVRAHVASARRLLTEVRAQHGDGLVLAYQTLMAGYLTAAERGEYENAMRAFIASSPPGRAMWVELEVHGDPDGRDHPARLRVHASSAPGTTQAFDLAMTGYHPRTMEVNEEAVRGLLAALAPA